jgi:sporulation protein YlmC with PRC-barrel domain
MRKALATTSLWIALVALPGVALAASDSDKTAAQTHSFQATKMIGTNVKDMSGNTIGEVDDVLLTTTGNVRGIVSDVGGFLGVGERHVLLDWNAIVVSRDGDDLKITSKFTKATLENLKPYEWTAKKM